MEPETIELPFEVAEGLKHILTTLYYQSQATDLLDDYRQLRANNKVSPQTKQIKGQIEILGSWIEVAKAEAAAEEEPDEGGDSE